MGHISRLKKKKFMKICAKVAYEIYFPTMLCMLKLIFSENIMIKLTNEGQIVKTWMPTTPITPTLLFHTCHGSVDLYKHVLIFITRIERVSHGL